MERTSYSGNQPFRQTTLGFPALPHSVYKVQYCATYSAIYIHQVSQTLREHLMSEAVAMLKSIYKCSLP